MSEDQNLCTEYQPRLSLFVTTLVDKNAAVAEVSYHVCSADRTSASMFTETGSSKRDKGDQFDRGLGEQFAVARALVKLGKAIERDAAKQVAWLTPAAPAPSVTLDQVLTEANRRDSLHHISKFSDGTRVWPWSWRSGVANLRRWWV